MSKDAGTLKIAYDLRGSDSSTYDLFNLSDVKQSVRHIHSHHSEGDLLMDAPDVSWEHLLRAAADRDAWRQRVCALRMTPGTKWRNLVRRLLTKH